MKTHMWLQCFKMYKTEIKFENREIRRGLMISYVKLVINYIERLDQVVMDGV
jgi:hypothetical protein